MQAATNLAQFAPGALGTIYGAGFSAPADGLQTSYIGAFSDQLPTSVDSLRVLVLDTFGRLIAEAPIVYADDDQINFQMPFEVEGHSQVQVMVVNGNVKSAAETVQVTPSAPGVFTFGDNRALAINPDGSLNTADSSAPRLKTMTVYMTGQGRVAPEWPTGRAATISPLVYSPANATVRIGGVEGKIRFLGLTPGLVGVLQLNVEPAYRTPTGDQDMVVNIGGYNSNIAKVTIR